VSDQTVLIVDDEPDILQLLEITLARMNLGSLCASNVKQAKQLLAEHKPDLCLTDMKLPDGSGMALIEHMQQHHPDVPVAMITAHGSVESAIEALKLGAFDFVTKPLALDKLRELVSHALQVQPVADQAAVRDLIGSSAAMVALRDQVGRVARSQAPVHIHGESGTGKEVVARLIHRMSPRADQPFVAVNCGAIPPDLVESELFGHVKGAFTGATQDKIGLFEAARGGTLLLDEVADLPIAVQVKLLRVIQEKSIRPVGAASEKPTDVRLISATHKNLADEVRAGRFRDDLYYRINVIGIEVPALRERPEDIRELTEHLLNKMADEHDLPVKHLDASAFDALIAHRFPGNVRELENILARASALTAADTISAANLEFESLREPVAPVESPPAAAEAPVSTPASADQSQASHFGLEDVDGDLEGYMVNIEKQILEDALLKNRWNKTATAKALGISFRSLRYRLKKLGLDD
jgi:two-component system response regulator PilR (NtrC family)